MKEEKVWFNNSKGQKLCGLLFVPEGRGPFPITILCHGLSSSKTGSTIKHTTSRLSELKIASLAIDFSGHGESDGEFKNTTLSDVIGDTKSALDYVEHLDFIDKQKVALMGSSYGGIAALMVASQDSRVRVLSLRAPAIKLAKAILVRVDISPEKWKKMVYAPYHSTVIGDTTLKYSFYLDALKHDGVAAAKNIKIPTIISAGDKDTVVLKEDILELYDTIPSQDKKIIWVPGASHWFSKEQKEKTFKKLADWVAAHLK